MAEARTKDRGSAAGPTADPAAAVIESVGDGWAHGFLPAGDLLAGESGRLRGPCDGCGVLYYTEKTAPRVPCPNCGHLAASQDGPA